MLHIATPYYHSARSPDSSLLVAAGGAALHVWSLAQYPSDNDSGVDGSTVTLIGSVELPVTIDAAVSLSMPLSNKIIVLGSNGAMLGLR